jgi:hypothetical protein
MVKDELVITAGVGLSRTHTYLFVSKLEEEFQRLSNSGETKLHEQTIMLD